MSETLRIVRAIMHAQECLEVNKPVRPATVRILVDEIMRLRRMIASAERKANRKDRRNERMDIHRDGGSEGTAPREGDRLGEGQGADVDAGGG